jgi:hypothetical protein
MIGAALWKNGVRQQLPHGGEFANFAKSVFVHGNDVYVAGGYESPVVWKNGVPQKLPKLPGGNGMAKSVFVVGSNAAAPQPVQGALNVQSPAPAPVLGQKPTVAVLVSVANSTVSQINRLAAYGALQQFIVNSGRYKVVDRSRTDQIVKSHKFDRDGMVDTSKIKEIGKMLQADMVCVSELRKEDGAFLATCSIIDVESGEVAASAYELVEGETTQDVKEAVNRAAEAMVGASGQASPDGTLAASGPAVTFTITATGARSFSDVSSLEKALKALNGVDGVKMNDYKGGVATFDITTGLSPQALALALGGIQKPPVTVLETSSSAINLRIW